MHSDHEMAWTLLARLAARVRTLVARVDTFASDDVATRRGLLARLRRRYPAMLDHEHPPQGNIVRLADAMPPPERDMPTSLLDWFEARIGPSGLLGPLEWWNFVDWVDGHGFDNGEPPSPRDDANTNVGAPGASVTNGLAH